jgi:hypothetical protein
MEQWFRSWHGAPTDPKWLVIARRAGVAPGMVSAVFWALMDYASQNSERGNVDGFDIETYALWAGWDEVQVEAVIEAMRSKGVITDDNTLAAWDKRQPKRERDDDSSERVRRYRNSNDKPTNVTPSNAVKRQVTPGNANDDGVTPSNAVKRLDQIENRSDQKRQEKTDRAHDESGDSVCLSDYLPDAAHLLQQHNINTTPHKTKNVAQIIAELGLATVQDAFAIAANKGKEGDWNYVKGIAKRLAHPVNGNGSVNGNGAVLAPGEYPHKNGTLVVEADGRQYVRVNYMPEGYNDEASDD